MSKLGDERNVELSSLRPLLDHLSLIEGGYCYYDKSGNGKNGSEKNGNSAQFALLVKLDKQYDYAIVRILHS